MGNRKVAWREHRIIMTAMMIFATVSPCDCKGRLADCSASRCSGGKSIDVGCSGTSPTGVRWRYIQPQHTGTAAVVCALRQLPNVSEAACCHAHTVFKPLFADEFAFTFVASPRHRVISSIICNNRSLSHLGREETTAVVHSRLSTMCEQARSESGAPRFDEPRGNGRSTFGFVHPISSFFPLGNAPSWIGRTSHLQDDFDSLIVALGYEPRSAKITSFQHHFSSRLELEHHSDQVGRYYDQKSQDCVDRMYAHDIPIFEHAEAAGGGGAPVLRDWNRGESRSYQTQANNRRP